MVKWPGSERDTTLNTTIYHTDDMATDYLIRLRPANQCPFRRKWALTHPGASSAQSYAKTFGDSQTSRNQGD